MPPIPFPLPPELPPIPPEWFCSFSLISLFIWLAFILAVLLLVSIVWIVQLNLSYRVRMKELSLQEKRFQQEMTSQQSSNVYCMHDFNFRDPSCIISKIRGGKS